VLFGAHDRRNDDPEGLSSRGIAWAELQSKGLEFCADVIAKAGRLRVRIAAPPISCQGRTSTEGKTRGRRDGAGAARTLPGYHSQR
jgi:hypothetical protein